MDPLAEWLTEYPEDSAMRLVLAQAQQSAGNDEAVIQQYALLLDEDDRHAVALNNLTWIKHLRGDSEAVGLAARAHLAQPESGAIADTYGWILVQNGEVNDGIDLLRLAAKTEPRIGEIRYHLAAALAQSGSETEARQLLTELLASGEPFESRAQAEQLLQTL